jgi:O-antigen biosynthesis protein
MDNNQDIKLSVIIVNYNVEYFLEQCLNSVLKALKNTRAEVFVVDNNSVDGSVSMVKAKFPEVILIENKKNTGFSFANNQAIKASKGEYVLLLNPDTVVEEDTFEKTINFMDTHPDGGGLGVYMIDGKGNFLPESKRGLPTPEVAFYKIFGLSALFPKSRKFGKYHLGFLDKKKIHEVEILSGAFMLLRKKVLDNIGLLDETFFMYGEDIDLSYRIIKAGYKNYYFPDTRIIHYKGESTKKSSINYVFVFYNAMIIFARKHFSQKNAKTFSFLINLAVYLRAGIAIINRFIKKIALPALDASIILAGLLFLKFYWENVVKVEQSLHYQNELIFLFFPLYILTWLISIYYSGGYDKPVKPLKIFRGIAAGTAIILIAYSLLSEDYRFSRAMIVFGAIWTTASLIILRILLHFFKIPGFHLGNTRQKRVVIAGNLDEFIRVYSLLKLTEANPGFIGHVAPNESNTSKNEAYLGTLDQLEEIINIHKIDEIIFCARDLSAHAIINHMAISSDVNFKIAPPESLYIIGSNSIETSGELYTINVNAISKNSSRRNKRLFDLASSFFMLATLPAGILIVKKPIGYIRNILLVLLGFKSWVSYIPFQVNSQNRLPKIKKGVLSPADPLKSFPDENNILKINQLYAKDYKIGNDLSIIGKCIRELGKKD